MSNVGEYQKEVVAYLLEVRGGVGRLKTIADGAKQMQKKRYQQPFLLSSRQELDALEQKIVRMKEEEAKKKQRALSSPKSPESPVLSNSPMSPKLPSAGPSSPSAVSLPAMQAKPEIHQRNTSKARKAGPGATQQAPVFASQNDALEFTEEEDRRFRVENVMLHRHFQENLEDAKYAVGVENGVENGRDFKPYGSVRRQDHGTAERYRAYPATRARNEIQRISEQSDPGANSKDRQRLRLRDLLLLFGILRYLAHAALF
ncbi:hypothetical protein ON010_g10221 [Phytophthora cinnamomi]|nr:hypothetical protein ON010_g10221 [Phytophthora cinnamomi]